MFSITDIQSQLQYGGARPSLFSISLTNPVDPAGSLKVPFMVNAASIPSSVLGSIPVAYFGRHINVAGVRNFDPWAVQVLNDEDWVVRRGFESWSAAINSYVTNIRGTGTSAPAAYKGRGQVTQYAQTGDVLQVYNFDGLIPVSIGDIQLSWASGDQVETFAVQFVLDDWTIAGESI